MERSERGVLSSSSDDDGGGFIARCASSSEARTQGSHHDGHPGPERSPGFGQSQQFSVTELMINAVRGLDRSPRPRLAE